ncbi:type II toxin-antitoxin system HicA family toxin [Vulcanococcus sp.]|uniref:type II toxin-antitoxin system HicA family toxin n=1 Tax=Vulcanococcus sp. TaxID=2856995 RepID=UPI0037D9F0A1
MKLPTDLNGVDLANKLRVLGYATTRQTGSHRRLTRLGPAGQQHLTIPAHRPLRVGTLRAILKGVCEQCGLELSDLLHRLEL